MLFYILGGSWSVPVKFLPSASAWMTQEVFFFIILMTHLYSCFYEPGPILKRFCIDKQYTNVGGSHIVPSTQMD